MPSGRRSSEPAPVPNALRSEPMIAAVVVIMIGRKHSGISKNGRITPQRRWQGAAQRRRRGPHLFGNVIEDFEV